MLHKRGRLAASVCMLVLVMAACARPTRADFAEVAGGEQATRDRGNVAKAAGDELTALRDTMP